MADLFNKGVLPAIDVGNSVSRVGSAAQTKAMKSVAGGLKLELAQFRDLEAFMQFAQDLDKETAERIASGQRMVESLKQKNGQPLSLEKQVAVLYAATHKFFADVPVSKVTEVEGGLRSNISMASTRRRSLRSRSTGVVSDDGKKELN